MEEGGSTASPRPNTSAGVSCAANAGVTLSLAAEKDAADALSPCVAAGEGGGGLEGEEKEGEEDEPTPEGGKAPLVAQRETPFPSMITRRCASSSTYRPAGLGDGLERGAVAAPGPPTAAAATDDDDDENIRTPCEGKE